MREEKNILTFSNNVGSTSGLDDVKIELTPGTCTSCPGTSCSCCSCAW